MILAGDIGETEAHLALAFEHLKRRFAKLIWVPGNHELWTVEQSATNLRGKGRYEAFVALARRFGVIRPRTPIQNGRRGTAAEGRTLIYCIPSRRRERDEGSWGQLPFGGGSASMIRASLG